MIIYYFDASAWVKRYYLETGTVWIQDLFFQNPLMACSNLGFIEVAATLARKRKADEIDTIQHDQKQSELESDWENFIQIQCSDKVTSKAIDLAKSYALRGADAIHLASALHLYGLFSFTEHQLIFVTSDIELKEAAQAAGLNVVDPNDHQESEQTNTNAQQEPS